MAELSYDRILTVYRLGAGPSPPQRRLQDPVEHYYREMEVYGARYVQGRQVGETITMMVAIPRMDCDERVAADLYCVPEDGRVYRIFQAAHGFDANGMPITTLSLSAPEGKYELLKN